MGNWGMKKKKKKCLYFGGMLKKIRLALWNTFFKREILLNGAPFKERGCNCHGGRRRPDYLIRPGRKGGKALKMPKTLRGGGGNPPSPRVVQQKKTKKRLQEKKINTACSHQFFSKV